MIITRFAPSPTGQLHLGSAYSAVVASQAAAKAGGRFLLRIEDTDQGRCRPEFEDLIYEDLSWLGLTWEKPVRRQSEHLADYERALGVLRDKGLIYPCFCTRKEITAEIENAGAAPHGPDGPVYPGTCRRLSPDERASRIEQGEGFAERLDIARAFEKIGLLTWNDAEFGVVDAVPLQFGDVVLMRKDGWPAYHLAVVCDDHVQGITLVTRGNDLFHATHLHRLLQELLGFNVLDYLHHKLLIGADGKRLAKRDQSVGIADLRKAGRSPTEVRALMEDCAYV